MSKFNNRNDPFLMNYTTCPFMGTSIGFIAKLFSTLDCLNFKNLGDKGKSDLGSRGFMDSTGI